MRLREIDDIDWAALHCCCGDAGHVPLALYALCSEDPNEVERAYWKLENHVVAQNTIYLSAEPIPGIVVGLWPHVRHKSALLDLLFRIAAAGEEGQDDPLYVRCLANALQAYRSLLAHEEVDEPSRKALQEDLEEFRSFGGS